MPIIPNLKTLEIVQGVALARQLQGRNLDGSVPTQFDDSATLACSVWPAQGLPAVVTPTCTWNDAPTCVFNLAITAGQSAQLSIDATYYLEVIATQGGVPYAIALLYLQVLPSAASQASPGIPDLISLPYAMQLLAQSALTQAQVEQVPTLITSCSNAIRGFCNRDFLLRDRTVMAAVELDGTVRLGNPPINKIYRIQDQPQVALSIGNSTATSAWVSFETSGGLYLQWSGIGNLAPTGVTLNWQSGGATSSATVPFGTNETIQGIAADIGAVGDGWSAVADPILGLYPVTELYDWDEGKGAGPNDLPDGCAQYHVFTSNATSHRPHPDDGAATGIWLVGRQGAGDGWGRWGPFGPYDRGLSQEVGITRVRVSYSGGPAAVPAEIAQATAELLKIVVSRFQTDLLLESETAGEVSYRVANDMIAALPKHVKQSLSRYRLVFA